MINYWSNVFLLVGATLLCSTCQSVIINTNSRLKVTPSLERHPILISKSTLDNDLIVMDNVHFYQDYETQPPDNIIALQGELFQVAFELENILTKDTSFLVEVSHNQQLENFYRLLPVADWYTQKNAKYQEIEFYPDALYPIQAHKKNQYSLYLKKGHRAKFILQFKASSASTGKIKIKVINGEDSSCIEQNIQVLEQELPISGFSSIIFNQTNLQSGGERVVAWMQHHLTHLQVNYVPTVIFDSQGNPVSGIDPRTSSSTGFRNTAYPWIINNGKILLFWQPRYDKLALTQDGSYLKPFSEPWLNAYKNLLGLIEIELKKINPKFNSSDIIIYLADEVSRFRESDNKNYRILSNYIDEQLPGIKKLLTYGYYTDKQIVDSFDHIDIHVPHIRMPEYTNKGEEAIQPQKVYKAVNFKNGDRWMYSVEAGKKAPLYKFYSLPAVAAAHGYTGYSWYSFVDHAGSTWDAVDGNRLDYSMFYAVETNQYIYDYWNAQLGTPSQMISSLRLLAAGNGLQVAAIIQEIKKLQPYFDKNTQMEVDELLLPLTTYDIEKETDKQEEFISLIKYRELANNVRLLYSRIKTNL